MKKLLLHICCAPDATVGIERLSPSFAVEGFFVNPNIHPGEEYGKRLQALKELARAMAFSFSEGPYDPEAWFQLVSGLEGEPEKGLRCQVCIRERLRSTAREARERGFDAFAAVLTVSPHKDAAMVNRLGVEAGEEYGVAYIPTDLKKQDGFKRSVELTRKHGIYRQDYCGCRFSRNRGEGEGGLSGDKIQDPE